MLGCSLFVFALLFMVGSIIPPTLFIDSYVQCASIPAFAIVVEYGVLSFSYIYVLIHVVLFVYHCHLRTQLSNMNIDDVPCVTGVMTIDAQSHD